MRRSSVLSLPLQLVFPVYSLDNLRSAKEIKKDNLKRFVARRRWLKYGNMVR
jgi:hypothetical protein